MEAEYQFDSAAEEGLEEVLGIVEESDDLISAISWLLLLAFLFYLLIENFHLGTFDPPAAWFCEVR